jgi:hypothetical protein
VSEAANPKGAKGRAFDPDWSLGVAALVVAWLVVVSVGAWFFWNAVTP